MTHHENKSLKNEHMQTTNPRIHNKPNEIETERERCTKRVSKECLDAKLPKKGNSEENKLMFDDAESQRMKVFMPDAKSES